MRSARRPTFRSIALLLAIGLLAFTAFQRNAAGCARSTGTEQCRRPAPVKGSELLWESLSRGIGSAVAL
ncbi:MAG: hypothetical protein EOO11_16375 [Chitinophagaceae bacterium]|nr:MAG: hypothetical protein EOO11_16375 [Chitinophagaceae bacterium]